MEAPHVLVCPYCALATMLVMLNAAVPEFVSVTLCAALGVPTAWFPKPRLAGAKLTIAPAADPPGAARRALPGVFSASVGEASCPPQRRSCHRYSSDQSPRWARYWKC